MKLPKQRREEAAARKLARSKRTPQQQLAILKTRPGDHKHEAARLIQLTGPKPLAKVK